MIFIASSSSDNSSDTPVESLRRQIRLVTLLEAAENSGLAPIPLPQLHMLAYLVDVLSPVWKMPRFYGRVLKREMGPFYPQLQDDLDRLVGSGVVVLSDVSYAFDPEQGWRLQACFQLNHPFSDPIIKSLQEDDTERVLVAYIQELAHAVSALSNDDIQMATKEDATYSDPLVDTGEVVDFAEWKLVNPSASAARQFEHLIPGGARATNGEMLHLYVQHLHARLHVEH